MEPPRLAAALLPLVLIVSTRLPTAQADEAPPPASGSVRLPSGLSAHYEYHFNHNALGPSQITGNALIGLTESGNLLRFDLPTRRLTRERITPSRAVCLRRGIKDELLAGFEDGRVCRVDPTTLELVELARLSGKPQWVGALEGDENLGRRIFGVVERSKWMEQQGHRWQEPYSVVEDIATGKTYEFDRQATTFLLDHNKRLWLGADKGEWGGWCSYVDLAVGRSHSIPGIKKGECDDEWNGVYGFVELRDGQVWAYGGLSHMNVDEAFIRRVDRRKSEEILYFKREEDFLKGGFFGRDNTAPHPDRPDLPITSIVEEPDGHLLVLTWSNLYKTDLKLRRWKKLNELNIEYDWGFGGMGVFESVHLLEGDDWELLCTTGQDGFVRITADQERRETLPGQLEAHEVIRIKPTSEGTFFEARYSEHGSPFWRLQEGSWTQVEFDRRTDRPSKSKPEVLGRQDVELYSQFCFVTPDGTLWNARSVDWDPRPGELKRFQDGHWTTVATLPDAEPKRPAPHVGGFPQLNRAIVVGPGLQAVGKAGPPWILLDREENHLLSLTTAPDPHLDLIRLKEGDKALQVHDAIPWKKGELLLATDLGLRVFDVSTTKSQPAPIPDPEGKVKLIARDGLGRLWLAGEGLWMFEPASGKLHNASSLPMIGRTEPSALAADPDHTDGVIEALGQRGVVFVRIAGDQQDGRD